MLSGDVEAKWTAGGITRQQARRLWQLIPQTLQSIVEEGPDLVNLFVSGAALGQSREIIIRVGQRKEV
jgi:hypothetical protein